jgi:hypothetical protein
VIGAGVGEKQAVVWTQMQRRLESMCLLQIDLCSNVGSDVEEKALPWCLRSRRRRFSQ